MLKWKQTDLTLPYLTLPYLVLIFCCSAFSLTAQNSFIEALSESTFLQGNAKRWIYDSLKTDSRYVNVTPIRVNDLWSFQTAGILTFSLPHVQFTLNVRAIAPRRYTSTRYSWTGTIVNQYNQPIGRAAFFQEEDKYFGTIDLPNRKLVIRDLNAGIPDDQVLVEFDQTNLPNEICGMYSSLSPPGGPTGGPEGGPPPPPPPPDTCQAVVAALFLYTQRVLDEARDPVQIATMAIQALNETLDQSASSHTDVRVIIAGLDTLTSFDDYANEAADCEATINTFMPMDSTTQALRNQYRADIVILLQETDIYYDNGLEINYGVVGIADINEASDSNEVYSVVEAGSVGVTKTIVHEVGHLFGCRHRDGGHSFANGFQLCLNPNEFGNCQGHVYTIMNPSANDSTIYRFSNADSGIQYQGVPIGADDANNMRMINRTACNISEFRVPLFYPFISGPTNVGHNVGVDYDYSSLYQNCIEPQGPSSYTWEVSWDYGTTYSFLSSDEDAVLEGEDIPTHAPWGIIRLTAVCGGEAAYAYLDIKNWTAHNISKSGDQRNMLRETFKMKSKSITPKIYPNPAKEIINLKWENAPEEEIMVSLISTQGQRNLLFSGNSNMQNDQLSLAIRQYPPGYYIVEVKYANHCFKKPLIIHRP